MTKPVDEQVQEELCCLHVSGLAGDWTDSEQKDKHAGMQTWGTSKYANNFKFQ